MGAEVFILLTIIVPLVTALLVGMSDGKPNQRETVTLFGACVLFAVVLQLLPGVMDGVRTSVSLIEFVPGLSIRFELEPLGMMFALIASFLWIVSSIYSIGYMRGKKEGHQTRFFVCFAIAIASAMCVAMAGNMLTLFIGYEVLSLSTYPLVAHHGDAEARRGGRIYLGFLLSTSIGLLLFGMIWTWHLTGTLEFQQGGILQGHVEGAVVGLLLVLYMFGIGKAALMPFHRWLPAAMVAPTPVSALLHAVAVVKAGVFSVLKVVVYIFGVDFLGASENTEWLGYVAAGSLVLASLIALQADNLKRRLAYSTVSQLAYVTLGAAMFHPLGIIGGAMHIAMHAFGKITLFFCAGAIYVATGKTNVSQLNGLGRIMPFTFIAFFIGACSVIGLPPLGGMWSKYYLSIAAADNGQIAFVAALMISSVLNVAYLMPIVARGFFRSDAESGEGDTTPPMKEAPVFCVVPLCISALGCIALFFFAEDLYDLLLPVAGELK